MLYNGNLDTVCPVPAEEGTLHELEWYGNSEYRTTSKIHWRVSPSDADVAGYVRQVMNFYQVCSMIFFSILSNKTIRSSFNPKYCKHKKFGWHINWVIGSNLSVKIWETTQNFWSFYNFEKKKFWENQAIVEISLNISSDRNFLVRYVHFQRVLHQKINL